MTAHNELLQLINDSLEEAVTALRVCLPGRVETYDPDTMLASVQPLLKVRFYRRAQSELLPIIANVPVCHPRTATAMLRLPVATGDLVTLVFSDRSLENWLSGNGEARETLDPRKHHLSDAFALLGGYPGGRSQTANNPNAAELVVSPGTKITVGNGAEELLQLAHDAFSNLKDLADELSQTLTDIQALTVTAPSGGGPTSVPINAAAFAATQSAVDAISSAVQTTADDLAKIKA